MKIMFKTMLQGSLAAALLLSNLGVQLMGCVTDPGHQACHVAEASVKAAHACHHASCERHQEGSLPLKKASKNAAQPLACLQACSAGLVSLKPADKVQIWQPELAMAQLPNLVHVFIPSSEPRSIFHPPA